MAALPPSEQERALGALRIRNALRSLDPECERCGDKGDVMQDDDQGCFTCRACGDVVQGVVIASDVEWRTFSDHSGPVSK
jgi:hypothetical protein